MDCFFLLNEYGFISAKSQQTNLRAAFLVECRVIGNPATLFTIEPERVHADALLEVKHPAGTNVNHRGTHSCKQQHGHIARSWYMICNLKIMFITGFPLQS